jgi:phosphatidylserine/phosphatidylglycerophosphate/cardiolipin synthase-like enzyme
MKGIIHFILISTFISGCSRVEQSIPYPTRTETYFQTIDNEIPLQNTCGATKSSPVDQPGIEIYFTNPTDQVKGNYSSGIDNCLVNSINQAMVSIDIATYSINLWSISNALIDAYQRGIRVRIVIESDNIDDETPQDLRSAGIPIIGDRREGLMHNKFMVIDGKEVWTGSANMTIGSIYYDDNNLVHIISLEIAEDYTTEFDEMFERDMFGNDVVPKTPHPQVLIGKELVEIYFSPDDHVASQIITLIDQAKKSIYFLAYSFTSNDIGTAIIERSNAGILTEGIMDQSQVISNTGTEYDSFIKAGIKVYSYAKDGLMHNKVIIIDRKIVITGSYNFGKNAEETNDENVVIIHSSMIAEKYLSEYTRIITTMQK